MGQVNVYSANRYITINHINFGPLRHPWIPQDAYQRRHLGPHTKDNLNWCTNKNLSISALSRKVH